MSAASDWIEAKLLTPSLSWDDLVSLVMYAQEELGVSADGKPDKQIPVPKGRKQLVALYGNPSWHKTGKGRSVDLDDAWERKNIRWFKLHTGKRVRLHRLVGAEFVAIFKEACEVSGYTPTSVQTFVPRTIGRSDKLSLHSYGVAVDFAPNDNWLGGVRRKKVKGKWTLTDEPALMLQHPGFSETWEKHGWTWGHRWSFVDTHHIQRATP